MKTVHKFPVLPGYLSLVLTEGAQVLHVGVQRGQPFIWVLLDPTATARTYQFQSFGTGHNVEDHITKDQYIGTFMLEGGGLVFHLFQVNPR